MVEQANERHRKIKELDQSGGMELTNAKTKKGMDNLQNDDKNHIVNLDTEHAQDGEYQEQYNANHDFAIFQVGNDAVGGLMNLQQKQNQADIDAKSLNTSQNDTYRSMPDQSHEASLNKVDVEPELVLPSIHQKPAPNVGLPEDQEFQELDD